MTADELYRKILKANETKIGSMINDLIAGLYEKLEKENFFPSGENTWKTMVDTAEQYLGMLEGSAQHRRMVDDYNKINPLPVDYKLQYNDAWCAAFLSVVAEKAGCRNVPKECGVERLRKLFVERNQYYHCTMQTRSLNGFIPDKGDYIFLDRKQDNWCDHVGLVIMFDGKSDIYYINGNCDNRVCISHIPIGHKDLHGFARPDYT